MPYALSLRPASGGNRQGAKRNTTASTPKQLEKQAREKLRSARIRKPREAEALSIVSPVNPIQAHNDTRAAITQANHRRTSGPSAARRPRSTPPAPRPTPAKK